MEKSLLEEEDHEPDKAKEREQAPEFVRDDSRPGKRMSLGIEQTDDVRAQLVALVV